MELWGIINVQKLGLMSHMTGGAQYLMIKLILHIFTESHTARFRSLFYIKYQNCKKTLNYMAQARNLTM